ncbi:hypothetical protein BGZ95_004168 [Linnemannia exigua]|uniref:Uncharacterized protein n=1 Tax=Linnemannia exigua TaxID=604196 RepID=A0AAD4H0Y7_9FUNG|nr:hypothetical protein BGZ95_004168 [Linnemannia exigua]
MQDPSYDYTLKGFFPYWLRIRSGYIILRDGIFYRGDIGKYFTGVLESVFEGIKNITGTFAHPADGMMHFYLFGGRRKNATFFGGLGSYQIEAGAMAGPYTVNIPNNINSNATFHSQHQRVIASMRTPPAPLSGDSAMDKGLLGFIIAMLLSAVLTPIISCLVTRRRKHIRAIKEKADEEVRDSISKQEEYFNEGIIPYSESDGGTGKGEHVPGYTGSPGQDNNIVHLGFSRHPRPNIVTSLGDD